MYYYIYDSYAQSKEMGKELARIESRLLDFGIRDKVAKISPLKSVRDAVSEAYKHKYDTIIAVGEDPLVLSILAFIVGYKIVLGVVPLGKQNLIGNLLSMPHGSAACELISARKIQEYSIGKTDGGYFFSSLDVVSGVSSFTIDGSYTVTAPPQSTLSITNIGAPSGVFGLAKENPQDGKFTIALVHQKRGFLGSKKEKEVSVWRSSSLELHCEKDFIAKLDGVETKKPISTVQNIQRAVRCIVGKTRIIGA